MLGSPHTHAPPQSRAGFRFGVSLNSSFGIKMLSSSPADAIVSVHRTDMTLQSFMIVPNSHAQVYIKAAP